VEANVSRWRQQKLEAEKSRLHQKIFHWPQTWTFPRTRTRNYRVCALEEKNGVLLICEIMKYQAWELARSHITAPFQGQHGLECANDTEEWVLSS
jgi:hypothetical protein